MPSATSSRSGHRQRAVGQVAPGQLGQRARAHQRRGGHAAGELAVGLQQVSGQRGAQREVHAGDRPRADDTERGQRERPAGLVRDGGTLGADDRAALRDTGSGITLTSASRRTIIAATTTKGTLARRGQELHERGGEQRTDAEAGEGDDPVDQRGGARVGRRMQVDEGRPGGAERRAGGQPLKGPGHEQPGDRARGGEHERRDEQRRAATRRARAAGRSGQRAMPTSSSETSTPMA